MPTKRKQPSLRKPRSDARRNRERILEVAKGAFTRSGANTSLDDIARDAGVGPGTLYRHFPTREELLEAVYRTEMEKLASAEQKFAEELPPIEALRAWLLLFVDYIAAKQLIAPALNALLGDPKKVFEASYARMWEAIRALVKRAIKSGDIRKDLDAIDLLRALIGVANARTGSRAPDDSSTSSSTVHAQPNRVRGSRGDAQAGSAQLTFRSGWQSGTER
jgi:AcrR family transcriptional regulator